MQNNPQKGLEDFLQTLTEVEKSKQMGILSDLFGAEFGDDMALLVSGIENYKKAVSLANDKNKAGSLQREFETRAATTENALTLLKSSILNLGITIGSVLLPPLNAMISVMNPIVNGFASFAESFPALTKVVVGAAVGVGTLLILVPSFMYVLSAMTLGLGKVAIGFKLVSSSVLFLSRALLLNPIGLAITAIAGAAFLIYQYWTPIKEFFLGLWEGIKAGASVLWDWFKTTFKWLSLGLILSAFSPVSEFFKELLGGRGWIANFKSAISWIGNTISSIKEFFGFGEVKGSLEQTQKVESLRATPLNPSSKQNNISVAFTGGIQVQTTDGKIPENSQLQRDIQREVEAALKNSQDSQRNRTLSDIDF
ncbi:phage tail tape measure protein [Helicobacter winghamensis]|uniref:phage tail tape measure protein n=1 Tax=Helicobacter winghamensis TaxID=157268 RepID=UPI00351AC89F